MSEVRGCVRVCDWGWLRASPQWPSFSSTLSLCRCTQYPTVGWSHLLLGLSFVWHNIRTVVLYCTLLFLVRAVPTQLWLSFLVLSTEPKIKLLKTLSYFGLDDTLYSKTFAILTYCNYWIRCLRIDRMFWWVANVSGEVGRSHKARTPTYLSNRLTTKVIINC